MAAAIALLVGLGGLVLTRYVMRGDGLTVPLPVNAGPIFRPPPAHPGPSKIDVARLDRRFTELAQREDMVGLAVAIVENGQPLFVKGYGVTAPGGTERVTDSTVFRWASLSKGVAATMIAKLAEERRLSLEDPIARYAASLKLPGGAEKKATIADLLSHRLGLPKNAYDDKLEEGLNPHVIRRMLGTLEADCPPGTCHAYQNVAFDAASEIVEKVTGRSYATMVKRALFRPLGMTSASLTREDLVHSASWARPSQSGHVHQVEDAYYRIPAAGAVNSSIADLALWMRAQMGEAPSILPPALLAEIHDPRVPTYSRRSHRTQYDQVMTEASYALGWRNYRYEGRRLIGHRGAVDGYRSLILFDPARRTGVAVLWNSTAIKPIGVPLEVLDMLYGLPRKDWLELDVQQGPADALPPGRGNR